MSTLNIGGAVLAGGLSSRMGQEKARLHVLGDTAPDMLTHTVQLLQSILPKVWVACRSDRLWEQWDCLTDVYPGMGPFSGVHTALLATKKAGMSAILVLPCDVPLMDSATLQRLVQIRQQAADAASCPLHDVGMPVCRASVPLMTTYRQAETGYIEALVAIYEVAALPFFERAHAQGQRQINLIIPPERRTELVYTKAQARPFFNVNFPEDVAALQKMRT